MSAGVQCRYFNASNSVLYVAKATASLAPSVYLGSYNIYSVKILF